MRVKYLGKHKKKSRSTERYGDTFYKLIFENSEKEKINVYVFKNSIDLKQWNFIEEERLRVEDILEIKVEINKVERFGRYEEYLQLIDFKVIKGVWYVE